MTKTIKTLFLFVLSPLALQAFFYEHPTSSWSMDVPEGFTAHPDPNNTGVMDFHGPKKKMVIQIYEVNHSRVSTVTMMLETFAEDLGLEGSFVTNTLGEMEYGLFLGKKIIDLGGRYGKQLYRFYMAGYHGEKKSFIVLGKIPEQQTDIDSRSRYEIESAIESFAPHENLIYRPGVFSILRQKKEVLKKELQVHFGPYQLKAGFGLHEAEVIWEAIIREIFVLLVYDGKNKDAAWQRFYRMIYRNVYSRLEGFIANLKAKIGKMEDAKKMALIYNAIYHNTANVLDNNLFILNPLDLLIFGKGDCDSKVMMAHLLADHLGIKTQFLYALHSPPQVGHAALGVDARLFPQSKKPKFGKDLLYFEMLKKPHPKAFANPKNWRTFTARYR